MHLHDSIYREQKNKFQKNKIKNLTESVRIIRLE